jgi:hypothetical protein
MFLLAGALDMLMRMTLGIRDCSEVDSNCFEISLVFLLAGMLEVLRGRIDESGNFLTAVPCTFRYQQYFCLQEY